jgi:rubrerythrin
MARRLPVERTHRGFNTGASDGAPAWRLDWDAVLKQQAKMWFCNECGYYHQAE